MNELERWLWMLRNGRIISREIISIFSESHELKEYEHIIDDWVKKGWLKSGNGFFFEITDDGLTALTTWSAYA